MCQRVHLLIDHTNTFIDSCKQLQAEGAAADDEEEQDVPLYDLLNRCHSRWHKQVHFAATHALTRGLLGNCCGAITLLSFMTNPDTARSGYDRFWPY